MLSIMGIMLAGRRALSYGVSMKKTTSTQPCHAIVVTEPVSLEKAMAFHGELPRLSTLQASYEELEQGLWRVRVACAYPSSLDVVNTVAVGHGIVLH